VALTTAATIPSPKNQPTAYERSGHSDSEVTDHAKAGPANEHSSKPACYQTDHRDNEQAFVV
jgi:hypothetical protein